MSATHGEMTETASETAACIEDHPELLQERNRRELAEYIAQTILSVFDKHYRIFLRITRGARERFIEADWVGERNASRERITLYTKRVAEAAEQLKSEFDLTPLDKALWALVKRNYVHMLYDHKQPELAETFYNSVFTWFFDRRYYNNDNIFIRPSISTEYMSSDGEPTYFSFYPSKDGMQTVFTSLLEKFDFGLPFRNLQRDISCLARQCEKTMKPEKISRESYQLHVLASPFYRNKAVYLVGRFYNGLTYTPFVIPILNDENGCIYVDAFVSDKKDITNVFSFTRAYFMVDTDIPSSVIRFLQATLTRKTAAELYTAIGLQKQGKTEFFRDLIYHFRHSTDRLKVSAGTKGMVMSVFTLPSYPFVFKVINDRFAPPKEVTRKQVKEKYQLVKMHDRVGRMADTLEFSHVSFPRERFSEELLEELHKKIADSMLVTDDSIIIRHLYIERRLTPLNLFLESGVSKRKIEMAIIGYGNAIKEMAAANIFPGDLLTKNFGVTRHGRVIFYDYDEIELLNECNFRHIPPPRTPEDEMASEPWYSIKPMDVFPEEFLPFLFSKPEFRKMFLKHHADLLEPEYWQSVQQNFREGRYPDVFPYAQSIRFSNMNPEAQDMEKPLNSV